MINMRQGIVYTETVVHAAPEKFAAEAPYQVAIVQFDDETRITARVTGDRVTIGDKVIEAEISHGVTYFTKI